MLLLSDIRTARKRKKMTQTRAAKEIDCQRERINGIETGTGKATISELETLVNAYGFNICLLSHAEFGILQGIKAVIEQNTPKMAKNKGECSE